MGTIVLDAGVVIAMLERQDAHHREARTAILAARDRGDRFILPASAYSEVLVHPSRRDQRSVDIADQAIEAIPAQIQPIDRAIARSAASLRALSQPPLRLPDALVIATAMVVGADRVYSTDRRLTGRGVDVDLITGAA